MNTKRTEKDKRQKLSDKVDEMHNREDDEDLMFFRTLLSHVKKIPNNRKLSFRCQIQEVVDQFAYGGYDYR